MSSGAPGSRESAIAAAEEEEGFEPCVLEWLEKFSPKVAEQFRVDRESATVGAYRIALHRIMSGYRKFSHPLPSSPAEVTDYVIVESKVFGEQIALAWPPEARIREGPENMLTFDVEEVLLGKELFKDPKQVENLRLVKRVFPGSRLVESRVFETQNTSSGSDGSLAVSATQPSSPIPGSSSTS